MKKMMRTLHFLCLALVLSAATLSSSAQRNKSYTGSSNYITKQVAEAGDFQKIRLGGSADVEYRQVATGSGGVEIYSPDNLIDLLEVKVVGNVLDIRYKENVTIKGNRRPKIIASSSGLKNISSSGSGNIEIKSPLNGNDLEIALAGSGSLKGEVFDFETISVNMAGSGYMTLDRLTCDQLGSNVSGSGYMDVATADAKSTAINIAGSGNVTLARLTCDLCKAAISGSGSIKVTGTARLANFKVSGSGGINAGKLIADEVTAMVSGSGSITCHAVEVMEGDMKGSGIIRYRGDPKQVSTYGRSGTIIKQ